MDLEKLLENLYTNVESFQLGVSEGVWRVQADLRGMTLTTSSTSLAKAVEDMLHVAKAVEPTKAKAIKVDKPKRKRRTKAEMQALKEQNDPGRTEKAG